MSIKKRLPTALIILAVVFVCIQFLPAMGYFIVLQVLIAATLLEFYALHQKKKLHPQKALGLFLALVVGLSFYIPQFSLGHALIISLFAVSVFYIFLIKTVEELVKFPASIAVTYFGVIYIGFTLDHLYILREQNGPFTIYFLIAVIAFGDTGAYTIGKLLGKHKMTPLASPRKTWEGSFGGILFAAIAAAVVQIVLLPDILLWKAVVCGVVVHIAAQLSDPVESLFKRAVGVKDSSQLLPGHGGFLDRLDSFFLAAPLFTYFILYFW
ncbi:MAG: phosphatidate cytidylyltransferase [Candidatus Aminicenantes bacterium]|nr:phosphatidate cytidylyltransferase [Candidatus Aminicenantes bacterium]